MSVPTTPTDLTGKKIRSWYVVAYAGVRDGLHYWRCMCRFGLMYEKVVAEWEILDKKLNTLSSWRDWTHVWEENLSDCIFGEWTVNGLASQSGAGGVERPTLWRCRCVCGVERHQAERPYRAADTFLWLSFRTREGCGPN